MSDAASDARLVRLYDLACHLEREIAKERASRARDNALKSALLTRVLCSQMCKEAIDGGQS